MQDRVGKLVSVDFNWFLNVYHGSDYFRRWLREKSSPHPWGPNRRCRTTTTIFKIRKPSSPPEAAMSAADSSVDAPLSRSDQALYGAKEHGRNRIECL